MENIVLGLSKNRLSANLMINSEVQGHKYNPEKQSSPLDILTIQGFHQDTLENYVLYFVCLWLILFSVMGNKPRVLKTTRQVFNH